jgi:hypothetical protein
MSLPDDVNECRACGVPIHWPFDLCKDCEPARDAKGRFMKRPTPEWLRGMTDEPDADDQQEGTN